MTLGNDYLGSSTGPMAEGVGAERALRQGEVVGNQYEVRGLLGEGAQGLVYEAFDQLLARPVALKLAKTAEGDSGLWQESRAMAAVRSASVPQIHGLVSHRGAPVLVMERVFGTPLDRLLSYRRGQAMPVGEALELLIGLGSALVEVHRSGIAHRDVKPANVIIAGCGRTVLMDFGIVLPEVEATAALASGTPFYLAPEQLQGTLQVGEAHLVDIYSLGVVAFELLTGRVPFDGEVDAILHGHLRQPVPHLSMFRRDLPAALVQLIHEMMAKDPLERAGSMEQVVGRLQAIRGSLGRNTPREPLAPVRPSTAPARVQTPVVVPAARPAVATKPAPRPQTAPASSAQTWLSRRSGS